MGSDVGGDPDTASNLDDDPKPRRRRRGETHGLVEASQGGSGEKTWLQIPWNETVVACYFVRGKSSDQSGGKSKSTTPGKNRNPRLAVRRKGN